MATLPDLPSNTSPGELITTGGSQYYEKRGLEVVPEEERRGRPRNLGLMWSGVSTNVMQIVYGALLVEFGLNIWQSIAAVIIGNLTWIMTGLASLPGPRAGTTTFAVNRTIMGVNRNRLITLCNWTMQIGYEVLDMAVMALAVTALLGFAGVHVTGIAQVGIIVILSLAQSVLPLLGHAAITKVTNLLAAPFAVIFIVLAWLTFTRFHYTAAEPGTFATFMGGIALVASSSGLGWTPNATDMSRYLRSDTKPALVVAAVALGGGIPQTLLMILGVFVAHVSKAASDPVGGLQGAYPTAFVVIYLLMLLVQLAAMNGLNCYSSGLTLQAAGAPLNRWQAVAVDCILCTVLSAVVVTSGSFYTIVGDFLLFSVTWFSPWVAIYIVAYFARRGTYDVYNPPVFGAAGFAAQVLGMLASASCLVTSIWSGWFATAAGHTDLSVPAGLLIGGLSYWFLLRTPSQRMAAPTSVAP